MVIMMIMILTMLTTAEKGGTKGLVRKGFDEGREGHDAPLFRNTF